MVDTTFTFCVDQELKEAFIAAAEKENRTGEHVLRAFMQEYVQRRTTEKAYTSVRVNVEGLDDVAAGRVFSFEEIEAKAAGRRAETLREDADRRGVRAKEQRRGEDPRRVYSVEDMPDEIAEMLLEELSRYLDGERSYDD